MKKRYFLVQSDSLRRTDISGPENHFSFFFLPALENIILCCGGLMVKKGIPFHGY